MVFAYVKFNFYEGLKKNMFFKQLSCFGDIFDGILIYNT